jgi:hypothetical protein
VQTYLTPTTFYSLKYTRQSRISESNMLRKKPRTAKIPQSAAKIRLEEKKQAEGTKVGCACSTTDKAQLELQLAARLCI